MLGRELRRIAKRAPLPLRLMLRAFNPHAREDSHGVTETQRRFTAGALPQTPKASPLTSDKITGFYRIDRIFLISNPVNHDNPVILSHYHPIGFSRRGAERQSSQRTSNFRSLLSLMQTALKFLDEKINFSPVLSVLSASLREIYTGCY